MEWLSSYTFTIYSVGDGLFMKRVLDAIASLSNSGMFQSLGALGLLLGLLLVVMRAIGTGGRQVDLPALFLSFIMYSVMFGGKADVVVEDVGLSPGERTENVYTVDNVPFGVAALGWGISNISYNLSEKLEQAYGLPNDDVGSLTSVGFGRTLDWLTAVRYANVPSLQDKTGRYPRFRQNIVAYLRYCTTKAMEVQQDRFVTMTQTADPFDTTNGIGFASGWDTLPWMDINTGATSDATCAEGITRLKTYATSNLFEDYSGAVAAPMGYSGTQLAPDQALDAFGLVNISQNRAAEYMAANVINASLTEAMAGVPIAGDAQVTNAMMVTQSTMQRATKYAGEETMFRKMIRPMMAFFESLLYIAAPFMALAVGLGRQGLGMVGKYCIMTLWVSLWMPTLTAINMFQETMVDRALSMYVNPPAGDIAFHNLSSISGANLAYRAVEDWISTGSMLAASTPAITLMLLLGGAAAGAGLAQRMQGADTTNEKLSAPDVTNAPPVMQRDSMAKYSIGGGQTVSGADMPNLEFSSMGSVGSAREYSAARGAMTSYEASVGQQVGQALTHDIMAGFRTGDRSEQRASNEQIRAVEALKSAGVNFDNTDSTAQRMAMGYAAQAGLSGNVSPTQLFGGIAGGMKSSLAKMPESARTQAIGDMAKAFGVNVSGGVKWEDKVDQIAESAARLTTQIQAATRNSESTRAAVIGANTQSAEQFGQNSASESNKVVNSNDYKQADRDWSQVGDTFRSSESFQNSAGARQSIPFNTAAQGVISQGFGGNAKEAVQATQAAVLANGGTPDDLRAATAIMSERIGNPDQAKVAAALALLNGGVPGTMNSPLAQQTWGERKDALQGFLERGHLLAVSPEGASKAHPEQGDIGREASTRAGTARASVEAAHPGVNADAVRADVSQARADSSSPAGRERMAGELADRRGFGGTIGTAESGGARGASMVGEGGHVAETPFAQSAGDTAAAGADGVSQVHQAAQNAIEPTKAAMAKQSWAVEPGKGSMDDTSEWRNMGAGRGSEGRTQFQAITGKNADGSENGGAANPHFDQAVQEAKDGSITAGMRQNDDMATVLGALQATKRHGGALNAEQGARVEAAYGRLSTQEKAAVNDYANGWDNESVLPKSPDSPETRSVGAAAPRLDFGGSTGPGSEHGQGLPGVPNGERGGGGGLSDGRRFHDERSLPMPAAANDPANAMFVNTNTDKSYADHVREDALRQNDGAWYLRGDQTDPAYVAEDRAAAAKKAEGERKQDGDSESPPSGHGPEEIR